MSYHYSNIGKFWQNSKSDWTEISVNSGFFPSAGQCPITKTVSQAPGYVFLDRLTDLVSRDSLRFCGISRIIRPLSVSTSTKSGYSRTFYTDQSGYRLTIQR